MAQARVYGVPGLSSLLLAGGCFVAFEKEGTREGREAHLHGTRVSV